MCNTRLGLLCACLLAEAAPTRMRDVELDSARNWEAQGYDPGDVHRFLSAYREALLSDNMNLDYKGRGAATITCVNRSLWCCLFA